MTQTSCSDFIRLRDVALNVLASGMIPSVTARKRVVWAPFAFKSCWVRPKWLGYLVRGFSSLKEGSLSQRAGFPIYPEVSRVRFRVPI